MKVTKRHEEYGTFFEHVKPGKVFESADGDVFVKIEPVSRAGESGVNCVGLSTEVEGLLFRFNNHTRVKVHKAAELVLP